MMYRSILVACISFIFLLCGGCTDKTDKPQTQEKESENVENVEKEVFFNLRKKEAEKLSFDDDRAEPIARAIKGALIGDTNMIKSAYSKYARATIEAGQAHWSHAEIFWGIEGNALINWLQEKDKYVKNIQLDVSYETKGLVVFQLPHLGREYTITVIKSDGQWVLFEEPNFIGDKNMPQAKPFHGIFKASVNGDVSAFYSYFTKEAVENKRNIIIDKERLKRYREELNFTGDEMFEYMPNRTNKKLGPVEAGWVRILGRKVGRGASISVKRTRHGWKIE